MNILLLQIFRLSCSIIPSTNSTLVHSWKSSNKSSSLLFCNRLTLLLCDQPWPFQCCARLVMFVYKNTPPFPQPRRIPFLNTFTRECIHVHKYGYPQICLSAYHCKSLKLCGHFNYPVKSAHPHLWILNCWPFNYNWTFSQVHIFHVYL
jgi:hypothetical protein